MFDQLAHHGATCLAAAARDDNVLHLMALHFKRLRGRTAKYLAMVPAVLRGPRRRPAMAPDRRGKNVAPPPGMRSADRDSTATG
jgi:hypothetical protein